LIVRVIFDIVPHVQIQIAVLIVVQKCAPDSIQVVFQTGLFGDVGEGPIAVIPVKDVRSPIADKEVLIAIIILVGGYQSHPHAFVADACFRCHVSKGTVAIIPI